MEFHVVAEGYEDPDVDLLHPDLLKEKESMKRYCLRNSLNPGTGKNIYTGLIGDQRYFVREDLTSWEVASHLVASAFMEQYEFETPEIEYTEGEIMISAEGNPPIPLDSNRREFKIRSVLPNFLQPSKADPESVGDSLFVHLAGGAHDISGNTVFDGEAVYPIDFQTFGKKPADISIRKFLKGEENYVESKFSNYGNQLGFKAPGNDLRRRVRKRSREFDEEIFWNDVESELKSVDENISENARRFAQNTVEYVEELEDIDFK